MGKETHIPVSEGSDAEENGNATDVKKKIDINGKIHITAGKVMKVNTNLWVTVQALITWFGINLVPVVALVSWLGLAVYGAFTLQGTHLSHDQRLLISIVVVGCFAALAFTRKSK
jgi:hypothetical protein